ncbi:MAG TPA: hypothetical protein EYO32_15135 [Rhodospirillales bacterium]|jgi:hypothetical protein|nr:hypothetical protein [Rhodospirillales bacterium]HIO39162.1 hypothetical protein [Rhodospirillales bacterium]
MTQPATNEDIFLTNGENVGGNLADHFLTCAKLGRYLTVASGSRFIITDDLREKNFMPDAAAMAAIYSRDGLVAEAALLPLSQTIPIMDVAQRDKYERLFHLIGEQTLAGDVRNAAQSLIASRFRAAEIRDLEAELGNKLNPARLRYRDFLVVVRKLMVREISERSFMDEFKGFTQEVAGRLDFGIYSFCIDSIYSSQKIPITVKKMLALEFLNFPPLIRRELISNILAEPGQTGNMADFVSAMIDRYLALETVIEIKLLKDLKLHRFSMEEISALVESAHVTN